MEDLIVKNVDVMGDSIKAAKDADGNIWVGVRWVCDALDMTEGQMKRQIKNIKKDMVFSEGGSNQIPLPTAQGTQEVFCIRNDFVPLWLAKIQITEKTREERPDFSRKLVQYQLKAKDILANAFLTNTEVKSAQSYNSSEIPLGELASYLKAMDKVAVRENLSPHKIAQNFKKVSEQFGVQLSEDFVNIPPCEQYSLAVGPNNELTIAK